MIGRVPGVLWLDSYERAARFTPGVLLVTPIAIALLGFGFVVTPRSATLAGAALAIVGPALLSKHVGNRGRSIEQALHQAWGGPPTTLLLRPPKHGLTTTLAQRRFNVERVTQVPLPDGSGTDHEADAESYRAAVLTLRSKTTDHAAFPLVFAENKSYGFERNLLGVRSEGLWVSGVCTLGVGGTLITTLAGNARLDVTTLALALAAEIISVTFWSTWPTSDRVKDAGTRYAERLLDAASTLTHGVG